MTIYTQRKINMLQPKFSEFRFIKACEVEFLRKLTKAATREDGNLSQIVRATKMTELYTHTWNSKSNYEIWVETGIIDYVTEVTEGGLRSKIHIDVGALHKVTNLINQCRYFGFYGVERDIVRLINLCVEQGRPLVSSDNYHLLTKYASLKKYFKDADRCLTAFPSGVGNGYLYRPTVKGELVHAAWVRVSEWLDDRMTNQGKVWPRVL